MRTHTGDGSKYDSTHGRSDSRMDSQITRNTYTGKHEIQKRHQYHATANTQQACSKTDKRSQTQQRCQKTNCHYCSYKIIPPPRQTSPSYSTADCPGVTAHWGCLKFNPRALAAAEVETQGTPACR